MSCCMAGLDQPAEIVERAELRVHGVVAAILVADGIEAAGVVRPGIERVVLALAVGAADRMDRRQVENVEAERGDLRHARDAVVERAVPARHRALAARHHLVPGAGAGALAVGDQWHDMAAGEVGPRFGLRHARPPACRRAATPDRVRRRISCARPRPRAAPLRRAASDSISSCWPSRAVQRDILAGALLEQEFLAPGRVRVGPGLDREQIRSPAPAA